MTDAALSSAVLNQGLSIIMQVATTPGGPAGLDPGYGLFVVWRGNVVGRIQKLALAAQVTPYEMGLEMQVIESAQNQAMLREIVEQGRGRFVVRRMAFTGHPEHWPGKEPMTHPGRMSMIVHDTLAEAACKTCGRAMEEANLSGQWPGGPASFFYTAHTDSCPQRTDAEP